MRVKYTILYAIISGFQQTPIALESTVFWLLLVLEIRGELDLAGAEILDR